jgi:hypothetical protein
MTREGAAALIRATERLATATSEVECESALAARQQCIANLREAREADVRSIEAALKLGEQIRLAMLREIVGTRCSLERLRAIAPACHAQSSVACTG